MMAIRTTGSDQVDTATAEIATHLRDACRATCGEQDHYDEAMRLRDEIMKGTCDLLAAGRQVPGWPVRTRTGRVLDDAEIEQLADEAERGYDVGHLAEQRHRHVFNGQVLMHSHEHGRPHGYFGHDEDPGAAPGPDTGTYEPLGGQS